MSDNEAPISAEGEKSQSGGEKEGAAGAPPAQTSEAQSSPGAEAQQRSGEETVEKGAVRHSRFGRRPDLRRLRHGIRPARLRHSAREGGDESGEAAMRSGAEAQPSAPERGRAQEPRRPAPVSVQELLGDSLLARARAADAKLRAQLMGSILLRFTNSGQRYLFDWSGDEPQAGPSDRESVDCIINLSEQTLLRIASGDLNPQIAMLSDKVNVKGRLSLAIYWFNLIVPGGEHAAV